MTQLSRSRALPGGRVRSLCRPLWAIGFLVCCLATSAAWADRSAGQGTPGLVLEKAGRYGEAALYYQRALRGFREVWFKFWYDGDMSKAHPTASQLLDEYQARLTACLQKAAMTAAQRAQMEYINALWMEEYVDHELGEYKLAFARRAEEAEKHGDFLFAEKLRLAAADYCRMVAIPYHGRLAAQCEAQQDRQGADLHRGTAEDYKQQAAMHDLLARGDSLLAAVPGLQGPASPPDPALLKDHYFRSYVAYHQRVLSVKGNAWLTGKTPQQVASILVRGGLKHAAVNARLASVTVLANLGQKEAVLTALADQSPQVRLAAAKALAATAWVEGWAACHGHADAAVRGAVSPLLAPSTGQPLARTATIVELLGGLDAASPQTRAFCQAALEGVTGEKRDSAGAWQEWWKGLGNARCGLVRLEPDGTAVADRTVNVGTWWQSGERCIQGLANPLRKYPQTAKIQWRGHLVVTQPGEYRFYVRNHGEQSGQAFNWKGESAGADLCFTTPSARLLLDGNAILPNPADTVEDPKAWMRIDYSRPIKLEPGLHAIVLELDAKCSGSGPGRQPSACLYWSGEQFLRQLVPAERLIHLEAAKP